MHPLATMFVTGLSIALGAPVLFTVLFLLFERRTGDFEALMTSGAVSASLLMLTWIWAWRSHVVWTRRRAFATIVALSVSMLLSAATFVGFNQLYYYARPYLDSETSLVLSCMSFEIYFLAGTAWAWRETKEEYVRRRSGRTGEDLTCPKCGYNMTGLVEARCPECGTRYTLDQIAALALDELV